MADNKNVRYLNPIAIDTKSERYCRFREKGFKYIDYKDPDFLLMLINEQGKMLPRRMTGTNAVLARPLKRPATSRFFPTSLTSCVKQPNPPRHGRDSQTRR